MMNKKTLSRIFVLTLSIVLSSMLGTAPTEAAEKTDKKETKCRLQFRLQGWSAIYETASGTGTITCDNGQIQAVTLETRGGGLTAGKSSLRGSGRFSGVSDISELFGAYAKAEAHAGVVKSAGVQVVTKGDISLAIKATGKGIDLGIALGNFRIEPIAKKSKK